MKIDIILSLKTAVGSVSELSRREKETAGRQEELSSSITLNNFNSAVAQFGRGC